jgi:outer membrane protein OmpA-like peptidoglycan-associated protein
MRRALISLILAWLCSVPVSHAQEADHQNLTLASLGNDVMRFAPAVEIGGAVEGNEIEPVAGPRIPRKQWFLGAYYRQIWVPAIFEKIFVDTAPSISTGFYKPEPNIGLLLTYRNAEGFSIIFGLGYDNYKFEGLYRAQKDPPENSEWIKSNLAIWHGTFELSWSTPLGDFFALEYGLGIDLGFLTGDITRTEAYKDTNKKWHKCNSWGNPNTSYDGNPADMYCDEPQAHKDNPTAIPPVTTDKSGDSGAHYGVKVGKWTENGDIPNFLPIPMIPKIGFRFAPIEQLVFKIEAAYGIMEFWAGVSVHVAIWNAPKPKPLESELRVVKRPEELPPTPMTGRVRGLVAEEGTEMPVANATVTVSGRPELAPALTLPDGTFLSDPFESGQVVFEIKHPDYQSSNCAAVISKKGGDVDKKCYVVALPKVGKIDGRVSGPRGPLPDVQVAISGPLNQTLVSDEWGSFSFDQAPAGTYLAHVNKEGYIERTKQFTVEARETTHVEITLTEKPKLTMVTVEKEEIKIDRQIHFATASAKIKPDSFPLMNEIASVFKSYPEIKMVEIQGHTDDRGSDKYNLDLSQRRADSVRDWLVSAGVEPGRLESRGYGESQPIESNKTKDGRAKNRRVQFIIKQRDQEPR